MASLQIVIKEMTCENFFLFYPIFGLTSPFFFQMLDKQTRVFHSPLTFIPCLFPRFLVRLGSLYCLYEEVMQSKNEGENGCWQQCRGLVFLVILWKYRVSPVCVCVYRRVLLPKTNRIESEIGSALSLFCYAPLELSTLQKLRRSGE